MEVEVERRGPRLLTALLLSASLDEGRRAARATRTSIRLASLVIHVDHSSSRSLKLLQACVDHPWPLLLSPQLSDGDPSGAPAVATAVGPPSGPGSTARQSPTTVGCGPRRQTGSRQAIEAVPQLEEVCQAVG
jgi:hypothetical protein